MTLKLTALAKAPKQKIHRALHVLQARGHALGKQVAVPGRPPKHEVDG